VFVGTHGLFEPTTAEAPEGETKARVDALIEGRAALTQLCRLAGADLRAYELDLIHPTASLAEAPAMDDEDCARAIAYGMMAVEPGIDIVGVSTLGSGGPLAAAAIAAALFGGGAGSWLDSAADAERWAATLDAAVARHFGGVPESARDPFEVLRCLGGRELAAVVGAIMAARLSRQPVILDGLVATAAAAILYCAEPGALGHCLAAQGGGSGPLSRLQQRLKLRPLLDVGLAEHDVGGAALALPLLKAAVACHVGRAADEGLALCGDDHECDGSGGCGGHCGCGER
jgi:nicotinate-nucleotide--dimethylbenzimidazole phosphoribosyltransferase